MDQDLNPIDPEVARLTDTNQKQRYAIQIPIPRPEQFGIKGQWQNDGSGTALVLDGRHSDVLSYVAMLKKHTDAAFDVVTKGAS